METRQSDTRPVGILAPVAVGLASLFITTISLFLFFATLGYVTPLPNLGILTLFLSAMVVVSAPLSNFRVVGKRLWWLVPAFGGFLMLGFVFLTDGGWAGALAASLVILGPCVLWALCWQFLMRISRKYRTTT